MIFNLTFKSSTEIKKYSNKSVNILFCKDNGEFEQLLKNWKLKISTIQKKKFTGDEAEEIKFWNIIEPQLTIIKKIDSKKKLNNDFFRNYLAGLIKSFEKLEFSNLYLHLPIYSNFVSYFKSEQYFYQSFIEGIYLGNYNFDEYKKNKKKSKSLTITLISEESNAVKRAISDGEDLCKSVYFSRDLVNEPANTLTPSEFARRVRSEFRNTNVKVTVFSEKELRKRKMNAILNVGKASSNKPLLIIVNYQPAKKATKKIVLVGKGVTYDTGGLSIKPTAGMLEMKADMAGGATVFGIVKAAALTKLPIEIIGIVPAVENAISGNAYKPGDVISTSSGKTIEVKDTDAEGRIVLADALEFASKQKPDEIIDFATLTGAVAVALGLFTAGIFTKNEEMAKGIITASDQTYEHVWQLPFGNEFNKLLESDIADISNLGSRWGGAITAGKFLEHFVDENIPWTHIDLAGPAIKHELTNYTKDYCTGFGVRLIYEYLNNSTK